MLSRRTRLLARDALNAAIDGARVLADSLEEEGHHNDATRIRLAIDGREKSPRRPFEVRDEIPSGRVDPSGPDMGALLGILTRLVASPFYLQCHGIQIRHGFEVPQVGLWCARCTKRVGWVPFNFHADTGQVLDQDVAFECHKLKFELTIDGLWLARTALDWEQHHQREPMTPATHDGREVRFIGELPFQDDFGPSDNGRAEFDRALLQSVIGPWPQE
jgi:hypothetical protein